MNNLTKVLIGLALFGFFALGIVKSQITPVIDRSAVGGNGILTTPTIFGYVDVQTNVWVTNTAIPLGFTNLVLRTGANTGGGITGVGNLPTSTERATQLTIISSGAFVFTNPVSIHSSDYLTTRTITNGNTAIVQINVIPGTSTNMALVQFR